MVDDVLAGYRIERRLGRGTMGEVVLAHPLTDPSLRVAIKRLHPSATDEHRDRLHREIDTLARLVHPHIISVLDVIDDGDSVAFVMPFAEGGSLAARYERDAPVTPNVMTQIVLPVADALDAAHQIGVLHRDVKPSNILFDAAGTPLLADFGIAASVGSSALTGTNFAVGTAGYVDPEVADGAAADARSDLYALGVVCYQGLTNQLPFVGDSVLAVLRAADKGTFERLDRARNGMLADVIERAFARRPIDRYPNVRAFSMAVRAAKDGPVSTPRVRRPEATAADGNAPESDGTTMFQRGTGPVGLTLSPAAPPSVSSATKHETNRPRSKRRAAVLGSAAVLVAGAGGGFALAARGNGGLGTPAWRRPACDPATTSQCVGEFVRTPVGLDVTFTNGDETVGYKVGEEDDELRVGNWLCGPRETLALYRPSTGVVYYFARWPVESVPDPAGAPSADSTGVRAASRVLVGDRNGDGCADVALDHDANGEAVRTWFLPKVQPARLQGLPEPVSLSVS